MLSVLLVALGGASGALLRYWLQLGVSSDASGSSWPWPTWLANALGCLCIGLAWGAWQHSQWFIEWGRPLLLVGLLGGFTTYSTFALETLRLAEQGRWGLAAAYAIATLTAALLFVWLGRSLGQWVQSA